MSNQEVITYQELPSSVESSTFTQIHWCRFTGKTTNEKNQKMITYILHSGLPHWENTIKKQQVSPHWKNNQWKEAKRGDYLHFAKNFHHQFIPLFHLIVWTPSLRKENKKAANRMRLLTYIVPRNAIIGWFLDFHASNACIYWEIDTIKWHKT